MTAYVVSRVAIRDPEKMKAYMANAPSSVKAFGGSYLSRTSDIKVLEGEANYNRMVLLEFPDKERALAWYESQEYYDLRQDRWDSADAHIVVVPGE